MPIKLAYRILFALHLPLGGFYCTSGMQLRDIRDLFDPRAAALQQDLKTNRMPVDTNTALVILVRAPLNGAINQSIFLEGTGRDQEMGFCAPGEYIYFYIKPGKRRLISGAFWGEHTLEADFEPNKVYYLKIESKLAFADEKSSLELIRTTTAGRIFKQEEDGIVPGETLQEARNEKEIQQQKIAEVGRIFSRRGNEVEIYFNSGMIQYMAAPLIIKKMGREFDLRVTKNFHTKAKAIVNADNPALRGDKVFAKLR